MREYNITSRIENGMSILTLNEIKTIPGIIEVKGKYVARISISGHKHLGTFDTMEQAIEMRLLAEEHRDKGTFEEWYKELKKKGA